MSFSSYKSHWEDMHQMSVSHMNEHAAPKYHPTQVARAIELLQNLLINPQDFEKHIRT